MKQKERIGFGSIEKLTEVLNELKPTNIFLVTGKKSFELCGAKAAMDRLLKNYNVITFNDLQENPKIEDVQKGLDIYKNHNPDIVIAVGGGSAIDTAKIINLFAAQGTDPKEHILNNESYTIKPKPLIAIPTTSGSGSEATIYAVVYIDKKKHSVAPEFLIPDYSIVDPEFTMSLPKNITASTGIDALGQAIEAFWSVNSTEESIEYSRQAIELAMKFLPEAVHESTKESRLAMARSANLSGKAINIAKTTACHALSYGFTTNYGIPHGHAVGLTLGSVLLYNSRVTEEDNLDKRGLGYIQNKMQELCRLLGADDPVSAKKRIESLMNRIGLETDIEKLGVDNPDLITKNVNAERLANNPRKLTDSSLKEILIQ